MRPEGYNPKRVWMEDKDCERLKRNEMIAVKMLLALLSTAAYAKDDLSKRLECLPNGKQRFAMTLGGLKALCDDVIGTISRDQARMIHGTLKDYELRIVPKMTPSSTNVVFDKQTVKMLVNSARTKCRECTADGNSCRECDLYKFLEQTTPLDDYGNGLMCPYWNAEFKD